MANKTQMTTTVIRGEVFTKDKPGYVELVNPPEQNEQIKTIINKLSQVTTNQSAQTGVLETIKDTLTNDELETLIKVLGVSRNILNTQQEIQDTLTQLKERLDEPIPTQLTGSNMDVAYGNYDQTISLNAGQAMSIKIEPPENEVWKLQVLRIDFPPVNEATTGNHRLIISTGTLGSAGGVLDAYTAHNKRLFVVSNRFGEDTFVDISKEWVQYAIRETFVSKEAPLYLYYLNQTDANIVDVQIPIRITRVVYKK